MSAAGCGSTRCIQYQTPAPIAAMTTRTMITMRLLCVVCSSMSSRSRSESLQILDERPLVGVGQRRAVWVAFVAAIAIAFDVRIENRKRPAFLLGIRRDEADVSQVINVIREIETLHALAGRLQQLPQVRHRTIVQVWSAQPDSVERHARVTVRLS